MCSHAPVPSTASATSSSGSKQPELTFACLGADDRRPVTASKRIAKRLRPEPALPVARDRLDLAGADAEIPERAIDRDVAVLPDEHADARRTL